MTNLFSYLIFGTLLYLFITLLKQKFVEHYTSNTELTSDTNNDEFDEDKDEEEYEEYEDEDEDEDEYVDEDENEEYDESSNTDVDNVNENIEIDVSNSKSEPVYINDSSIDKTIVLKDSLRKDSKVSSSLNFTYIDENCSTIAQPQKSNPIEKISSEPKTPLIQQTCNTNSNIPSWSNSKCEKSGPSHSNYYQKNLNDDKSFHSEMFDDSELKPKPNVDSPYGFVYFPNKYWKQWHTKSSVCTPVSECKVLPTYTEGTPVDVLDYTQIGSMMPKFEYAEQYESK